MAVKDLRKIKGSEPLSHTFITCKQQGMGKAIFFYTSLKYGYCSILPHNVL
jgi:hypothetical protein